MKKIKSKIMLIVLATIIMFPIFSFASKFSISSSAMTHQQYTDNYPVVVIDAGHGGIDGGATSHTGTLESHINLEIANRLNDLLHLLGMQTCMIRNSDVSVYTSGTSIAEKKVSDLKERVKTINGIDNAVLISIHQNYYPKSQYNGAQVFYGSVEGSKDLALELQNTFLRTINTDSSRQIKPATGIYLMQNIDCPGVLIECGFISNPEEALKLEDPDYQKKICSIIATTFSRTAKEKLIT